MSGDKVFVDTNVLVYAYDTSAGRKHAVARGIVEDLWRSGRGCLSTQVLQEFYVNVTRKLPKPLAMSDARQIVADLLKWDAVVIDGETIIEGIERAHRYQLSFWDGLIVAAAVAASADLLLSEDLGHGHDFIDVRAQDPFTVHHGKGDKTG
jgi:predicted nucleic acid-binding protein